MTFKKIIASCAAASIAATALATSAFAATTEVFGGKSDNFANSTLEITRGADGIDCKLTGTRLLSGQIELYLDTKECADTRENDATCWRFDLKDDGTIGGTHFAGGDLVTDGLVYNLTKNDASGYAATFHIPYSYLDIKSNEIFGISLGQWSTTANDWDGWGFEGQFVAPETPATYIRLSADNTLYRDDNNGEVPADEPVTTPDTTTPDTTPADGDSNVDTGVAPVAALAVVALAGAALVATKKR